MVTGEKVFFFCLCYHNKQTLRDGVYILNFDDSTKRAHDTNTTLKCIITVWLVEFFAQKRSVRPRVRGFLYCSAAGLCR